MLASSFNISINNVLFIRKLPRIAFANQSEKIVIVFFSIKFSDITRELIYVK